MNQGPSRGKVSVASDGIRFLVAGGLNTLLTLVIYQVMLFVALPNIAYAIAWAAGVLFVVVFYPSNVFPEGKNGLTDRLALGSSYVVVFVCGLVVLEGLTRAGVPPRVGVLFVMIVTTAASFVAGRLLLRKD